MNTNETIKRKTQTYSNRQPVWKQKLLHAREKWYLKTYAASRDIGVPLPPKYSEKNSNELTKTICAWLKFKEHHANKLNAKSLKLERIELANGGIHKKQYWSEQTGAKYFSGIEAVIYGNQILIRIQVENKTQKLSSEILKAKENTELNGGFFFIASSMTEFVEWYEETFENDKTELHLFEQTNKIS